MEYTFGSRTNGKLTECTLRTKGDSHTDLRGRVEVVRAYNDAKIYDSFTVRDKYASKEDTEGNCYDWYIVADHSRYVDRYEPGIVKVEERINEDISQATDGLMETYELTAANSDDIADCRTALEELYEMITTEE